MKPLIQSNKIICGVSVTKNVLLGIYVSISSFGLLGHPPYPQIPRQRKTCETYLYVYVCLCIYVSISFFSLLGHPLYPQIPRQRKFLGYICMFVYIYVYMYLCLDVAFSGAHYTHTSEEKQGKCLVRCPSSTLI